VEQDIVSQIMALIGQQPQRKTPPMIASSQFPAIPPPQGIMPQPGGMPPGAQDIALDNVLAGIDPAGHREEGPLNMQQYQALLQSRGTSPEEVLPPEILQLILQGKMSAGGGMPPQMPQAPGMNSPSGTMSRSPVRNQLNSPKQTPRNSPIK
jgi:hypothetical protein